MRPPSSQSVAEMRTDIGFSSGQALRMRAEDLEREAQAVLERAAVFVGARVGQRRDEARQQIAVRAVQLQHVEAGALRRARAACTKSASTLSMSARVISRGTWLFG